MEHVKYSDIGDFAHTLRNIKSNYDFCERAYDIIEFVGTIKLHGTNGGVSLQNGKITPFSRRQILSITEDNAGFAFFVESKKEVFRELFEEIKQRVPSLPSDCNITIFGEWAGSGVQSGVGIAHITKKFYIFDIKITKLDEPSYFLNMQDFKDLCNTTHSIFNIYNFWTYRILVDLNNPQIARNEIVNFVDEVEKKCPVAEFFGYSGIGEGIVWTQIDNPQIKFKTKGQKHSVTRCKKLHPVDIEKVNSAKEFVDYACTENRMQQGWTECFKNVTVEKHQITVLIKWVLNDIFKEEIETLTESGLFPKDVNGLISAKVRNFFFKKYEQQISE